MSYNEISAMRMYRVACTDCEFMIDAESAGAAETFARNHIEEPDKHGGMPNFNHTVNVYEFTAVGRQV